MSWAQPTAQYGHTPGNALASLIRSGAAARRIELDDVPGIERIETRPGVLGRDHDDVGRARELGTHVGLTSNTRPTLSALHFDNHKTGPLELVREALRHRLNLLESGELGARVAGMLVSGLTIGQAAPRLVSSEGDDLGGPPRGKTMRGDMSQRC